MAMAVVAAGVAGAIVADIVAATPAWPAAAGGRPSVPGCALANSVAASAASLLGVGRGGVDVVVDLDLAAAAAFSASRSRKEGKTLRRGVPSG